MKADFARRTFHQLKRFSGVLIQQGRVQLEADWNEQTAIFQHYLRALATDLIGPHGGPGDAMGHTGFEVFALTPPRKSDFVINAGHYYVDGILCELDSEPIPIINFDAPNKKVTVFYWPWGELAFLKDHYVEVSNNTSVLAQAKVIDLDPANRTLTLDTDVSNIGLPSRIRLLTTYLTQPDYPVPDSDPIRLKTPGTYGVYLDVWERLITYVEEDSIREVALDGPDTAARSKIVCQVKITTLSSNEPSCSDVKTLIEKFQDAHRG